MGLRLLILSLLLTLQTDVIAQEKARDSTKVVQLERWIAQEKEDRGYERATLQKLEDLNYYFATSSDSLRYARTLLELGLYYDRINKPLVAIPYLKEANTLISEKNIEDKFIVNRIKTRYASILSDTGQIANAIQIISSLVPFNKKHWPEQLDRNYYNIGASYQRAGERETSFIYLDSALVELNKYDVEKSSQLGAYIQHSKALNLSAAGYYNESLAAVSEAKNILIASNSYDKPYFKAQNYMYTAFVNNFAKDLTRIDTSIVYAQKGINLLETTNPLDITNYYFYSVLSENYIIQKKIDKALSANARAIKILKYNYEEENEDIAFEYSKRASLFKDRKQFDSTAFYFKKALSFYDKKTSGDLKIQQSDVLLQVALFNCEQGSEEGSLLQIKKAKDLMAFFDGTASGPSAYYSLSKVYHSLYENYKNKEYLYQAERAITKAIRGIQLNKEAIFNLKGKSLFFERQSNYFDYAMQLSYEVFQLNPNKESIKKALMLSELYRSSLLREHLNDSKKPAKKLIPQDLFGQEQELMSTINLLETEISNLQYSNKSELDSGTLKERLNEKKEDMFSILTQLKNEYPTYYNLNYRHAKELENIQQEIDGFLLQHSNDVLTFTAYEADKYYYFLEVGGNKYRFQRLEKTDYNKKLIRHFKESLKNKNNTSFADFGHQLYTLIFENSLLKENEYDLLYVNPDGIFNTFPFEALISKLSGPVRKQNRPQFLIEQIAIVYGNSILKSPSKQTTTSFDNILAMAPFTDDEPIFRTNDILRGSFEVLPSSLSEVNTLKTFENATILKGKEASETFFWKMAPEASMIHLATHSVFDTQNSMNSYIVFAEDSLNKGILYNYELFDKKFSADFVCLSSCESGLGDYQKGEGILNFARGFQNANVPNVLMTLWKVPDGVTSDLMKSFYKDLEIEKEYSISLRNAKLNLIHSDTEASHPYYWAAFVLNGPAPECESYFGQNKVLLITVISLLMISIVIIFKIKHHKKSITTVNA